MSDADLWASWRLWMAIATVIVLVAAALLITIIVVARRILHEAVRALKAAETIQAHTGIIWQLESTNIVAAQILHTVTEIRKKGAALAGALAGTAAGGRHAE